MSVDISKGVVAVHFWSPTCGPCKVIKPAIEVMKEDYEGVTWVSVNTHQDVHGTSAKFGVSVVPTIVFLRDGAEVGRHSGSSMGIYYQLIRRALQSGSGT
jgi:thioredoxin-like negative regulator of GroEL